MFRGIQFCWQCNIKQWTILAWQEQSFYRIQFGPLVVLLHYFGEPYFTIYFGAHKDVGQVL